MIAPGPPDQFLTIEPKLNVRNGYKKTVRYATSKFRQKNRGVERVFVVGIMALSAAAAANTVPAAPPFQSDFTELCFVAPGKSTAEGNISTFAEFVSLGVAKGYFSNVKTQRQGKMLELKLQMVFQREQLRTGTIALNYEEVSGVEGCGSRPAAIVRTVSVDGKRLHARAALTVATTLYVEALMGQ